jgi:hypothetical protein
MRKTLITYIFHGSRHCKNTKAKKKSQERKNKTHESKKKCNVKSRRITPTQQRKKPRNFEICKPESRTT